jgi:hypothetical protein
VSSTKFPKTQLVMLLASAVGEEKAADAVTTASRALNYFDPVLDKPQALKLLDKIAETPGLVGITAKFAKTRVHLKW